MKPKIKNVLLMDGGSIAVFDVNGQQIAELQRSLLSDWCDKAVALGYNPEGVQVEGEFGVTKIVKQGSEWNRAPV